MGGKSVQLKEATVSGEKPFLEHRVDKIVVNVENSIVNAGGTALEILQKSPGVTVDNNGNISLRGKQGVLVMMDGKPTYLSAQELYNMLRNMPADQLCADRDHHEPSAKYDAAGTTGIVNIRMRKNRNYGTNGDLRTSYGQGRYPRLRIRRQRQSPEQAVQRLRQLRLRQRFLFREHGDAAAVS